MMGSHGFGVEVKRRLRFLLNIEIYLFLGC